jgi:hypothetical protein
MKTFAGLVRLIRPGAARVSLVAALVAASLSASACIYMDEDFEGPNPFANRNFPVVGDTQQPAIPLKDGINLRAYSTNETTPQVTLSSTQGSVINTRSYRGAKSYRLNSGQKLAVAPGQFPVRNTNWFRSWQFAVSTDGATTGLAPGTQVGAFRIDYSNDSKTDLTPDVAITLALKVNNTGGVDLLCVNQGNALLGTLNGSDRSWLLVTMIAMNKVTTGALLDSTEGWAAYDSLAALYKGPQPAGLPSPTVEPDLSTGVHIWVENRDPSGLSGSGSPVQHIVLTRAGELGASWGNEETGRDNTSEIGWEFAAQNGGTVYLDSLYWDAGTHQEWARGIDREQAARMSQFAGGPLAPGIANAIRLVHMVVHAHLDIGFTKPPEVVAGQYKSIIDTQVNYALSRDDYKWTVEETWQLAEFFERSNATKTNQLVGLVNNGQFSVAAGHSTMHSTRLAAEDATRLFWNAAKWRNQYGFNIRTVFHDDVPGAQWSFPQMMVKCGMSGFVAGENMFIGGSITQPYQSYLFRWEGPDGSRVLTWSARESYAEGTEIFWWPAQVDQAKLTTNLNALTSAGYPYDDVMIQTAFDNSSGSNPYVKVLTWNQTHSNPYIVVATAEDFLDRMEAKYGAQIPVKKGNWSSIWDMGADIAPHEKKIAKNAQTLLPLAEQMNALANDRGLGGYANALFDQGWDQALQIDEHSGPGGCWADYWTQAEVDAANQQYRQYALEAENATSTTLASGVNNLLGGGAVPGSDSIVVYNGLSWQRTDIVRVPITPALMAEDFTLRNTATNAAVARQKDAATGNLVFVAEGVPPMGFRRYRIEHAPAPPPSTSIVTGANTIENARFTVVSNSQGHLTSIYDKLAGRQVVDAADAFQFNRAIQGTNMQWFFGANDVVPNPAVAPTITLESAGPVAAVLRVERANHAHAAARYMLYDGLDRIDIVNTPDRSKMLYASLADNSRYYAFPFPLNLSGAEARIDTAAGWSNPRTDVIAGSYNTAFCIQNCLDLSEPFYGVTIASPDVHVHAFGGFQGNGTYPPPNPTVVATFVRYGDEADIIGSTAGYVIDEPGAPSTWDTLHSLRPHARGFDPVADARFGWEVCTPLQAKVVPAAAGGKFTSDAASFFDLSVPNVIVTSVKKADFGTGIIMKMQEISGAAATPVVIGSSALQIQAAQPTTPLEADTGAPLTVTQNAGRSEVAFAMGPREIRALRLTISPAAGVNDWPIY